MPPSQSGGWAISQPVTVDPKVVTSVIKGNDRLTEAAWQSSHEPRTL